MVEVAVMAGVAAGAFLSSSLDNLFLLLALLSGPTLRVRDAALGYGGATVVVLAVALLASWAAGWTVRGVETGDWLRWLGLVPLGLGLWRVRALAAGRAAPPSTEAPAPATGAGSVFAVMLASSGDSLAVYSALLAESTPGNRLVVVTTALLLSAGMAAAARWLGTHPRVARRVGAIDRYGVPLLLVAIGIYILLDTSTDTV